MYFLVALGLYLCIHSNKTFLFCFHDNFLLIQNFLFHINIVALLSSLDWYFQGNFCKGLPVDILYDNMKLYQKLFLCVCVPRKKNCFERLMPENDPDSNLLDILEKNHIRLCSFVLLCAVHFLLLYISRKSDYQISDLPLPSINHTLNFYLTHLLLGPLFIHLAP